MSFMELVLAAVRDAVVNVTRSSAEQVTAKPGRVSFAAVWAVIRARELARRRSG